METLNKLAKEAEEKRASYKTRSATFKEELLVAFQEFFSKHSSFINAIKWKQWTPSFNDGDPCTFTMGDTEFRKTDMLQFLIDKVQAPKDKPLIYESDDHYSDDDETPKAERFSTFSYVWSDIIDTVPPTLKTIYEDFRKIDTIININEDFIQEAFGGDVEITIMANGDVQIQDYDCGY